jgi:hypothetical protein
MKLNRTISPIEPIDLSQLIEFTSLPLSSEGGRSSGSCSTKKEAVLYFLEGLGIAAHRTSKICGNLGRLRSENIRVCSELHLSLDFIQTHLFFFSSQVISSSSFLLSQKFTADDRVNGTSQIPIYIGVGVGLACFAALVVGLMVRWSRPHVREESDEEMSVASGGDQFITHTYVTQEFVTYQVVPFITCLNQEATIDTFAMLATEIDGWS